MLAAGLYSLNPGAIIQNRYQILSVLGAGGFAITYRAYDPVLQADIAIKEYFPQAYAERSAQDFQSVICRDGENRRRFDKGLLDFKKEAERTAQLKGRHNIVDVYGYCEQNGTAYMMMEYLAGMTLSGYLETLPGGRMHDMEDAARIAYAVAEGLSYIHSYKMLHRDISPDNIFLLENDGVRLFDFGAARDDAEETEHSVIVKAGCTPPEQYRRNGRQGSWTDIYALGATLYRMLTGNFPDPAPDRQRGNVLDLTPPSAVNPDVPEYLDILTLRCLTLDPHLRPRRAQDLMQTLSQRQRLASPEQAAKTWRRQRMLCGAAIAVVLVLIATISLTAFFRSETLYSARLSACTLTIQLPSGAFASADGLAAVQEDFKALYPMVTLEFSNDSTLQPAIFPTPDELSNCAPLSELRKVQPEGGLYAQTIAYDASLLYLNLEKAAACGLTQQTLQATVPENADIAEDFASFLASGNDKYAYRGSVGEYQAIQHSLAGLYALYDEPNEVSLIQLSVSNSLTRVQQRAAERFLLYLASERAQRILLLEHNGLIPAESKTREAYFATYPELKARLAELIESYAQPESVIN